MSQTPLAIRRPATHRRARTALLAAAVLGVASLTASPALAQSNADAQVDPQLLGLVEDFYHAASIASPASLAAAASTGEEILASDPDPQSLLDAFREVHRLRAREIRNYGQLDQRLAIFRSRDEISDVVGRLQDRINEGRQARATDPEFLDEQVQRLGNGGLAFQNAVANLRRSGAFAVAPLLNTLDDPARSELHGPVRRAIVSLGRDAVAPLTAALDSPDNGLVAEVARLLGELGYPDAVPHLLEQSEAGRGFQVQQSTDRALGQLGYTGGSTAATEYRKLAEQFWLRRGDIQDDPRFEDAPAWKWSGDALDADIVPEVIFDEVMAMEAAAKTLQLSQGDRPAPQQVQDEALSLWLASNYRREIELPEGATDPSRPDEDPAATYYGAQAGVPYLQAVLARAAAERSLPPESRYDAAAVALAAVRSMQQTIGQSTLSEGETPLTQAMNFPDRRVRTEAAMAIAQALPTSAVSGSEQVVPILAESLLQTGEPTVLLVTPNDEQRNAMVATLSTQYRVEAVPTVEAAFEQLSSLAGVDVFVLDGDLGDARVDTALNRAGGENKLAGSAKLILSDLPRYDRLANQDPTIASTGETEGDALVSAVDAAREQVGSLPMDEGGATELAMRAGEQLRRIGLGSSILSLRGGEDALLAALDDERPEVQELAAEVVALLDGSEPQQALLDLGEDDAAPESSRVAAFTGLATSAKRVGNQLSRSDTERLLEVAANTDVSNDVRTAAATAVGAMGLPVDQARTLIVRDVE
jgi:hypothetical protein